MTPEEVIKHLEGIARNNTPGDVDRAFYEFVKQNPELSAEALFVYTNWENEMPRSARPWELMKDYWTDSF